MKKLILFELNEVPFRVIDYFCRRSQNSYLSSLLERSRQYITFCEDQVELDPWISWPTLHRGVIDTDHKILHLGQMLKATDEKFPPIWRFLAGNGIKVGVFGSLHSNEVPAALDNYDFYIPDFFSDDAVAYPDFLLPFQRFNLAMTRRSARNVDTSVPKDLALDFLKTARKIGLSPSTLATLAKQLVNERVQPRLRIRRRSLQPLLMNDIFCKLLLDFRPQFATFYTNHVAAAMHRYWAATFPEDYSPHPMPKEWQHDYASEISFAMQVLDRMIGKLKRIVDWSPDTVLVIATSLGQVAVPHEQTRGFHTIVDLAKFMGALGVREGEWKHRPAMVPCIGVVVAPEEIEAFRTKLDTLVIDGHKFVFSDREISPLSYGIYDSNFVHIYAYFEGYKGAQYALIGNRSIPFEDIGFGFFQHEDNVAVTAHHDRKGSFIVYDPTGPEPSAHREEISTLEIAPSIIRHFGLTPPPYMRSPTRLAYH